MCVAPTLAVELSLPTESDTAGTELETVAEGSDGSDGSAETLGDAGSLIAAEADAEGYAPLVEEEEVAAAAAAVGTWTFEAETR